MMSKQIVRRTYSKEKADDFADLPPVLRRVYAARQVTSQSDLERGLPALLPFNEMKNITEAAELLVVAIREQQRILIVGDFDADGATSTALAMRALRSFGAAHVSYLVPNRFEFGYGLTPELVAEACKSKPDLIITVDNGIANHAGVEAAKDAGIKVLVTDHHLPAPTLPAADVIVNPNQPGDTFKSKQLAGVGVIFYVMLALRRCLLAQNWFQNAKLPEPNMSRLLDLVALGTVADLVALDQNNRVLVHQGLMRIKAGQCVPGIIALLERANRDYSRIVAADLGFAVGARLNAAGRLDDMSLGIECLLCDDSNQVRQMAETLDELNHERKAIEHEMQTQALTILGQLNAQEVESLKGISLYDESWHQGVIGILAARIKDRYHRPVIVFAPSTSDELKGSARSIPNLHIRDVLALIDAKSPGLIKKFGGHAMAAGLSIATNQFETFQRLFNEVVAAKVTEDDLKHSVLSDGELTKDELSLEVASLIRDAGPWGQAFPEPLFDDIFKIVEQRIIGQKHLKLRLSKDGRMIDAVAFFIDEKKWPNHRCEKIHAAYRLDVNEYNGKRQVQLILDCMEPV